MEFTHELPVNIILDPKSQPTVNYQGILAQYTFTVAQVEYEQVGAARIKWLQFISIKGGHQVMVEDRIFGRRIFRDVRCIAGIY